MLFPTMHLPHLHLGFRVASGFVLMGRLTHPLVPNTVPVRQVSGLPCDFLQIPPRDGHPCLRLCAWCYLLRSGLAPVRSCPCWAHSRQSPQDVKPAGFFVQLSRHTILSVSQQQLLVKTTLQSQSAIICHHSDSFCCINH